MQALRAASRVFLMVGKGTASAELKRLVDVDRETAWHIEKSPRNPQPSRPEP
jgi:hypothetical protein